MTDYTYETLLIEQKDFALYITLNRPDVRNAMNYKMVAELNDIFTSLRDDRTVRTVILSGVDGTFCAGGDIKEMRDTSVPTFDSASNLDAMLRAVDQASQIVIARVEGAALGGGLGLVCVSDIAVADETAIFSLPEVRLGIVPSFISPYVINRVGLTRARELMLTGRRFDGTLAKEYGFVHEACATDQLDHFIEVELDEIRQAAPGAIAAVKELIFKVHNKPLDDTVSYRSELLNTLRAGEEAQEGFAAFVQKKKPSWVTGEIVNTEDAE
ncbi:MAG: enoyl-CoA hydratase-related protein [Chloroflexota bacterium]